MKSNKIRVENAVRMNLSLHKMFKHKKSESKSKGGFWFLDPKEFKEKMSAPVSKPSSIPRAALKPVVKPQENIPVETLDQLAERIHEKALAKIKKSEPKLKAGHQMRLLPSNSVIFQSPSDGTQYLLPQLSYGITNQTSSFGL